MNDTKDPDTPENKNNVFNLGEFKAKRVEYVWEHHCGGQAFHLRSSGQLQCVRCGESIPYTWNPPDDTKQNRKVSPIRPDSDDHSDPSGNGN